MPAGKRAPSITSPSMSPTSSRGDTDERDGRDSAYVRTDAKRPPTSTTSTASSSKSSTKKTKRPANESSSGAKTSSSSDGEPSPSKKARLMPPPQPSRPQRVRRRMLTEGELMDKWKPGEKLREIHRDLKKLKAMRTWSQSQDDEVVVEKMWKYVTTIGGAIDRVVVDHLRSTQDAIECDELCTCLWQHAASFTPFSAVVFERLYDDICADSAHLRGGGHGRIARSSSRS